MKLKVKDEEKSLIFLASNFEKRDKK